MHRPFYWWINHCKRYIPLWIQIGHCGQCHTNTLNLQLALEQIKFSRCSLFIIVVQLLLFDHFGLLSTEERPISNCLVCTKSSDKCIQIRTSQWNRERNASWSCAAGENLVQFTGIWQIFGQKQAPIRMSLSLLLISQCLCIKLLATCQTQMSSRTHTVLCL